MLILLMMTNMVIVVMMMVVYSACEFTLNCNSTHSFWLAVGCLMQIRQTFVVTGNGHDIISEKKIARQLSDLYQVGIDRRSE